MVDFRSLTKVEGLFEAMWSIKVIFWEIITFAPFVQKLHICLRTCVSQYCSVQNLVINSLHVSILCSVYTTSW